MVVLCSPDNPPGVVTPPEVVAAVADRCADAGALLVVDEAYGQFAPSTALDLVADDRPLLGTRTFSKTWAMAAGRLGYAVAPSWVVEELAKVVLPYHLDAVTQLAGRLALAHEDAMAARVERIVANPIDNAERHGGGVVQVLLERRPQGVLLAVDDAGPGVDPADAERVFEPYKRGSTTGEGAGLGLALVREQAKLLGARVTVGRSPAGGARFSVELPVGVP